MKTILVVDLTHGGSVIALELSKKKDARVLAWDLYKTLDGEDEDNLKTNGIELVDEDFLSEPVDDLMVIAPVHSKLTVPVELTHH
ncbi:MAG TPA: coenzyme F430 synthase, partial [Methanobacteriaceae archaeon]|nr:coenzyme F430 synthase [Methanobacteriaceae archaeon]